MVALNDLKANDRIIVPWYGGKKREFRIDGEDVTYEIIGGGTQRRINLTPIGFHMAGGLLIHRIPKRGAASITVADGLTMRTPKEGEEKLGDTITFESLGKPCTVATELERLKWRTYSIHQRHYVMPDGHSVLLAERHFPPHGNASTYYYQTISITEKELRLK